MIATCLLMKKIKKMKKTAEMNMGKMVKCKEDNEKGVKD